MRLILTILFIGLLKADAQMVINASAPYRPMAVTINNLILDSFPGAAVAYSLRKLDKDYTGSAIRVRRSNDNTEQDIGFTASGDLDTASLKTFVGSNNGFVTTWYNQADSSGVFGTKNATQTTSANQPRIVNAGVVERASSRPTIQFNSHLMRTTFWGIDTSTYFFTFNVINPAAAAAADVSTEILWGYAGGGANSSPSTSRGIAWGPATVALSGEKFTFFFSNATIDAGRLGNSTYSRNANTTVLHSTVNVNNFPSASTGWYVNNDATTRTFNLNSPPTFDQNTNTSPANAGRAGVTDFWIKSTAGATNAVAQKYSELIIYNNRAGESGRLTGFQNNINAYYSIW